MPNGAYYKSQHWQRLREDCLYRDGYTCRAPGCTKRATRADHIIARPPDAPGPTEFDVLSNLRALCVGHDSQVKERRRGDARSRAQGGEFKVRGCDAEGWPIDPRHSGSHR